MHQNVGQEVAGGSVESVGCCHKCVNPVRHSALGHFQAGLDMGGAVVDTRQYVAVEIDQWFMLST